MILVTTTPSVDGYTITNYQGIVFGEVVSGVNMFKDLGAGLRNMFGGRSQGYEEELIVLLQCLFDRFGSVFPQCGLMVFPGVVIVSR